MFDKQEIEFLKDMNASLSRDLFEKTKDLVSASKNQIISEVKGMFKQFREEIYSDIQTVLSVSVIPQIDVLHEEVTKLKQRLA